MDKEVTEQLKKKLEKEKTDLEGELEIIADKDPKAKDDYDANFPDYGDSVDDNAAEVETYQTNLSLERDFELTLVNVKKALEKIEKGEYGICENCSSEIDEARLEAFPAAVHCMRCQKKEKKQSAKS